MVLLKTTKRREMKKFKNRCSCIIHLIFAVIGRRCWIRSQTFLSIQGQSSGEIKSRTFSCVKLMQDAVGTPSSIMLANLFIAVVFRFSSCACLFVKLNIHRLFVCANNYRKERKSL